MKNCAERTAISVFALTLFAVGVNAQLNPTVKVMSAPVTPVPAECVEGAAPQAQLRIEVGQLPEASKRKATAVPPSASLRGLLQDVQNAADRSDRAAFRDALARTKGMLTTYPTGGERTAATEAIGIYDDLDRIWTFQLETTTGAFFDAPTVPADIMRRYPGYERAVADQVFIDARGHRFYPTVETREFLLRDTAQRLNRLGVSVPVRAARAPRILPRTPTQQAAAKPVAATTKQVAAAEKPSAEIKPAEPRRAHAKPRRRARAHVVAETTEHRKTAAGTEIAGAEAKKPVVAAQAGAPKTVAPRSEPKVARPLEAASTAAPSTSTHETKPAEAPKRAALPASSSTAPSPMALPSGASSPGTTSSLPLASSPMATDTTSSAPVSATSTVAPTTAPTTAPTETTASAASTDTTATAAPEQKQGKSVILPIILIVVGIGVLIVLFRASS
jgi:hypothetical protein